MVELPYVDYQACVVQTRFFIQTDEAQGRQHTTDTPGTETLLSSERDDVIGAECPLDLTELGQGTWGFLHTMAAYYPDTPTAEQQRNMTQFFKSFSQVFPCKDCAQDLEERWVPFHKHVKNMKLCYSVHNIINIGFCFLLFSKFLVNL